VEGCCICIFAKPPRPGYAKTRLAPAVGVDGAAALAEAFLQDTWSAIRSLPWARVVVASTAPMPSPLHGAPPQVWLQGEGDLGARLERILQRALEGSESAIAIGADSPGLPLRLLEQAHGELREADAVIGPCEDGGFYLLGMRQLPPGLLAGISWSEANTFEQVVARLRSAGLRAAVLDPWFDVDRPEDLVKLQEKIYSREICAPETHQILDSLLARTTPGKSMRVSVILPVLNECESLPRTIAILRMQPWIGQIIVVDGGSADGTREWLREQTRLVVVDAPNGKGVQINAGAKMATGSVLLILHADSLLPPNAGEKIQRTLADNRTVGGCFSVHFDEPRPHSLRIVSAGINFRSRLARTATGDQAIFVRKQVFEEAGGCPDWPLFEDVELVRRIKKRGKFVLVDSPVTISARRYLRYGIVKTTCLIYVLRIAFWAGVSPFRLKRWFDDVRSHSSAHAPD